VTGAVTLLEVDDVVATELRGGAPRSLMVAPGFPRAEDGAALRAYDRGALSFLVAEDGVVVGTCGAHGPPDRGTLELGWGLVEGARGRGIGTIAVTQLLAEAQRRFPEVAVVAHTEWQACGAAMVADSPASESILQRLGFEAEAPPTEPGYRAWRRRAP
jgi:RimJ/RimL family protein N-acetyltransferase